MLMALYLDMPKMATCTFLLTRPSIPTRTLLISTVLFVRSSNLSAVNMTARSKRNMAPFVETEWGAEAYAIMRDLKSLFDPDQMLNPGVMINANPQTHVTHLKTMSLVSPEVDRCIECGFCESKCPSRRLTLTPRQRIVVQR